MNKKELWLKIKAYHFEHVVPPHLWDHITEICGGGNASAKAFANKIARKSGWTNGFALKALSEYKKFVYLAVVSDFNVTPSKIIDQVWHEHLLFSKAYRHFCSEVIDYTLDHNPELIAITDQTGIFKVQYMETIDLYKTEFGIDPPADIWSVPKFDQQKVAVDGYGSEKKKDHSSYQDAALVTFFDGSQQGGNATQGFPEFGGGEYGGAGAGGNWSDDSPGLDSSDNSSADGGSASGGDGGSSGCSSGCGGGGD